MTREQFEKGIGVLQAALRRRYSDASVVLFWDELQNEGGADFVIVCKSMARSELQLPTLGMILTRLQEFRQADTPVDSFQLSGLAKQWFAIHPDSWILLYPARCKMLEQKNPAYLSEVKRTVPANFYSCYPGWNPNTKEVEMINHETGEMR